VRLGEILDPDYREKLAEGLAAALLRYAGMTP
jgi:hypothetical protein